MPGDLFSLRFWSTRQMALSDSLTRSRSAFTRARFYFSYDDFPAHTRSLRDRCRSILSVKLLLSDTCDSHYFSEPFIQVMPVTLVEPLLFVIRCLCSCDNRLHPFILSNIASGIFTSKISVFLHYLFFFFWPGNTILFISSPKISFLEF